MSGIRLTKFNGIRPRVAPKLLEEQMGQTAENTRLVSGRLECIKKPKTEATIAASQNSLYRWYRNSSSEWLTWASAGIDVVRGPIADDQYERIYYTGDGTAGAEPLKVTGWDGSKETRNVSMSIPSAPTVAKSFLFDVLNQLKLRAKTSYYIAGVGLYDNDSGESDDAELLTFARNSDDSFIVRFKFPAASYASVSIASSPAAAWGANVSFCLGCKADGSAWSWQLGFTAGTPDVYVYGSLVDKTFSLSDDGEEYGTLAVKSVGISNRSVDYNMINATSVDWITPHISEYEVALTCKIDYSAAFLSTKYMYYVQSFVDDWEQEGPVSDISGLVTRNPGEKITITLPGATPGGVNIEKRRIYRSAAGTSTDNFYFLAEVDESTGTYVDALTDSALSEAMPDFKNPEVGMSGLIVMPGGWCAAFKDKTMYCSEPFLPFSWPSEYELTFEYDIVALAPSGNDIIVMTTGNPYLVGGSHPELLTQTRLMLNQSCISKRGVCQVGRVVVYPSPDGLVVVQGSRADVATKPFYSKEDWEALTPTSLVAEVYDKRYHGWASGGSIIFDFDEKRAAVTTTTETALGVFNDLQTDALFYTQGTSIKEWDAGTDNLAMTWRGKEFLFPRPFAPRVCRILSDSYPADDSGEELTLKLYAEGVLVATREVFSGDAFLLPKLRPERVWSFSVTAYDSIDEVALVTAMEELR